MAGDVLKRCLKAWRYLSWNLNRMFRNSVTISTKQGVFKIFLASHEFVGKSLYCTGEFELELMSGSMDFLRSIDKCPPKGQGTILDVGANNGVSSIGMLYTGEFERAIAVEPEPQNFSLLQHNVSLNKLEERVVALPFAASDQKGEISFELSKDNFGDHRVRTDDQIAESDSPELYHESERKVISVRADQLDNILANVPDSFTSNIAVMWIDVQGFEGYAFRGAKKLLSKGIPVVSEIWPYGLRRAGMSKEQFCEIVADLWGHYWVMRDNKFVEYEIDQFDSLIDELGYDRNHCNVIFTR